MHRATTITALSFLLLLLGCSGPTLSHSGESVPVATVGAAEVDLSARPPSERSERSRPPGLAIDNGESTIKWVGSKSTGTHHGGFARFVGEVELPPNGAITEGAVHVVIEIGSLHSDQQKLSAHLLSADFFQADMFPRATFQSTKIEKLGDKPRDRYQVEGTLELHGIKKRITFPATIRRVDNRVHAEATFPLSRQLFGMTYNGMPRDPIADAANVSFAIVTKAMP